HPHDVVFEPRGRFVVVPDKGLDATFVYRLDTASGKLVAADPPSVASRPGAGPRHVDFHPSKPYLYQINELDSTITTFRFDPERGGRGPPAASPGRRERWGGWGAHCGPPHVGRRRPRLERDREQGVEAAAVADDDALAQAQGAAVVDQRVEVAAGGEDVHAAV